MSTLRRWSIRLAMHAGEVLPAARSEWARAMQNEVAHIDSDGAALRWALGCVFAGYAERIKAELLHGGPSMKYHLISLACLAAAYVGYIGDARGSTWIPWFALFGIGFFLQKSVAHYIFFGRRR